MFTSNYFAMDYGASSGRGILGRFDGDNLRMEEVGRFENYFVSVGQLCYWDAFMLLNELKKAIRQAYRALDAQPLKSIGIDTWGTDYALLDANGQMLGNPRCMRNADGRYVRGVLEHVDARELFARTGLQTIYGNTLFQLYERLVTNDAALKGAAGMLMLPDMLGYFLTGEQLSEYTIVSTSMLYNPKLRGWDRELCAKLGIPTDIFRDIVPSASIRIPMRDSVCEELGLKTVCTPVGSHDTASAVAAAPLKKDSVFCSSGTWSLIGVESETPILFEAVRQANFSNEGTIDGKFRFLKNIMGMWILQECKKEWDAPGKRYTWSEIVASARAATPFVHWIDPENPIFYGSGHMVSKIQKFCAENGQPIPETIGEIALCVYQSIAIRYRMAIEQIEALTGRRYGELCIVGGGSQNDLLNQMAADAIERPVQAGPTEAACMGNLLAQAIPAGDLGGFDDIRAVVRRSFQPRTFLPASGARAQWQDAAGRMRELARKET